MSNEARELIRSVMELPELLESIDDDADLRMAGIDSGELILVALRCEQRLGRPLEEDELSGLVSIRSVASLLHQLLHHPNAGIDAGTDGNAHGTA